ncbi:hypothetical protein PoB_006033600 [Plakobranchus ocellatus]|uniref:Uncharacterized protein n=1 Tax=Plakobranchus ocellatus TaxID=259542 RepID=A0AAV4CPP9_9GAST|nr:hypothetical protein PoB_006033600 [Plakobranchus ocellatus]
MGKAEMCGDNEREKVSDHDLCAAKGKTTQPGFRIPWRGGRLGNCLQDCGVCLSAFCRRLGFFSRNVQSEKTIVTQVVSDKSLS